MLEERIESLEFALEDIKEAKLTRETYKNCLRLIAQCEDLLRSLRPNGLMTRLRAEYYDSCKSRINKVKRSAGDIVYICNKNRITTVDL